MEGGERMNACIRYNELTGANFGMLLLADRLCRRFIIDNFPVIPY